MFVLCSLFTSLSHSPPIDPSTFVHHPLKPGVWADLEVLFLSSFPFASLVLAPSLTKVSREMNTPKHKKSKHKNNLTNNNNHHHNNQTNNALPLLPKVPKLKLRRKNHQKTSLLMDLFLEKPKKRKKGGGWEGRIRGERRRLKW